MLTTIKCKAFHVRVEDGFNVIEAEDLEPAGTLPQLIKRTDCPARLACSLRHFDSMVAKAGIRPVEGLPVRYRESDLRRLTMPAAPLPSILALPKPASKPAAILSPAAPSKARKTRLSV
ncbi:MAG: hypothetical protein WA117_21300 [Verrucomicrobiia bacterium]